MDWRSGLSGFTRLAGRANKFTKSGNIGTVSSDAGRIDRQTQALGSFYIDAGVIELGQAKPNGWKHALDSARVHRARRSVTLPRTICNCEELVPIVFVPHFSLPRLRDSRRSRHKMHQMPLWSLFDVHKGRLTVYVTAHAGSSIDSLLLQVRYERAIIGLYLERRCRWASIDALKHFQVDFKCVLP